MRAGRLKHKIIIEQATEARDTLGAVVETWVAYATRQASAEPIAGREYYASRQTNAEASYRFRLRYLAGVTPKMRVNFGGRIFDIERVINVNEQGRELQIMGVER